MPASTRTNSGIAKLIKSKLIDWYKHNVFKRIKLEFTSNTNNCKLRNTWIQIIANYDKMLPNYACQIITCQLNEEDTKTLN